MIAMLKKEGSRSIAWKFTQTSAKITRKLIKTLKHKNFREKVDKMIGTESEIIQTKKSQSRWNLTDFSAAPKRLLILVDVRVCYLMLRIVVNLLDNEVASSRFQVPFLKRKEGFL